VIFVNTDSVDAEESRAGRVIQNDKEAELVAKVSSRLSLDRMADTC
jgi:hypothetical protein